MGNLYTTDILSLTTQIEHLGALDHPGGTARKVSKLCGSWLEADVNIIGKTVSEFALRLEACALGQASASILSRHILGASRDEIATARSALFSMLKDGGPPPSGRFAELASLCEVSAYPARHGAVMLAFDAALAAIDAALLGDSNA